jgi:cell division protein FtsA
MEGKRVVSCDIGSYKVVSIFGIKEGEFIKVEGYSPLVISEGIESGVVQNIEKIAKNLKQAVSEAFKLKGEEPKKKLPVVLSISGKYVESEITSGFVSVKDSDGEIMEQDRLRVIEQAVQRAKSPEKEIIYVHPNYFTVDDQRGIKEPVGMIGTKLEVESFVLKARSNVLKTLNKVLLRANLELENFVFSPIASSFAVLEEEEINQGTVIMDIGKGTIDIAIWNDEALIHAESLTFGGKLILQDLIKVLRITSKNAQEILENYGFISIEESEDKEIEVQGIGSRPSKKVMLSTISEIIKARVEEIFEKVKWHIERIYPLKKLAAGVVIVGGISKLKGITDICENIFDAPCIVGKPRKFKGLSTDIVENPSYAAALGALRVGLLLREEEFIKRARKKKNIFRVIWDFLENF